MTEKITTTEELDALYETIGERINRHSSDAPQWRYHLADGDGVGDAEFQPVVCGGGIVFPGVPVRVERGEVCPDCMGGRRTMPRFEATR